MLSLQYYLFLALLICWVTGSAVPQELRRGLFDDLKEKFGDGKEKLDDAKEKFEDAVPRSDLIPGIPAPDEVESILGIGDDQIAALPTQVLNIP